MAKSGKKVGQLKRDALLLKTCNRCHETKEVTEFHYDRSRSDGLCSKCKKCEYECGKARREKLKKRTSDNLPNITSKRCSKCGETKSVKKFYPQLQNKDGYSQWCKLCYQKQCQAFPGQ